MANYNSLKATIDANVKQNGVQAITGQILNSVLNQMVTTLGAGYQFAGIATLDPATDPGTPDAKVFYIANGKGTYTNFGGVSVTEDDVVVLYWDSSWHKVSTGIASNAKLTELESEVKLSGSAELNTQIAELYLDTDKTGLTIRKADGWLQIYDGATLYSQFAIVPGTMQYQVYGAVGYVVYTDSANSNDVAETALYGPYNHIEKAPIIYNSTKQFKFTNCAYINDLIKEMYLDVTESDLKVKIYNNQFLQVFDSTQSRLLAQFTFTPNAMVVSAAGSKKSRVIFNDYTEISYPESSYLLNSFVRNIEYSPTIALEDEKYKYIYLNDSFDHEIAELYLDTDKTGLTIRKNYGWLQIYDGTTLYSQFAISPNSIKSSVYGAAGYVVYTDSANSNDADFCELIGDYNIIEKNPVIYQFAKTINSRKYKVIKGGGGDYTSLLECVLEATKYMDSQIYVDGGEYDLISEFEDYYGGDFFTNYSSASSKGIILKNRVHIVFSTKAKVTCNYMGENNVVMQEFSPFNSGENGFTVENLNLSAYHCRYCVHDERGTSTDAYCNTYINCNMFLDNRNSSWLPNQCIGGGLGVNGTIRILDSIFESEDTMVSAGIVSYHNSSASNAQSTIEFVNCYCKGIGTFRLSWYGSSPLKTRAMVCGCSLGSAIINSSEAGATNNNTEIIEWNNVIRS